MNQSFRHPDILRIARDEGKVSTDDLAARLRVTVQTIRRDLAELAESGHLERVHGGAILPSGVANIGYDERRDLNANAKARIAAACAEAIPDGTSLFLNIGTSTEAVARALRSHKDLLVVTNNLNVATILASAEGVTVIVTGGTLRSSDGGLVGPQAVATIEQFRFDIAVIGCSALDPEGDILDFDVQEVGVSQSILNRARRTFLVADSSKFQRTAPVRIATLQDIDIFFTDAPLGHPLAEACEHWNTDVSIAP